jgi:hypothetical protein
VVAASKPIRGGGGSVTGMDERLEGGVGGRLPHTRAREETTQGKARRVGGSGLFKGMANREERGVQWGCAMWRLKGGWYGMHSRWTGGGGPIGVGPGDSEREKGRERIGVRGPARGKEKWAELDEIVKNSIYSNNFQMSSNYFDKNVDLPSSKNFK